jgi:hypothetical protein
MVDYPDYPDYPDYIEREFLQGVEKGCEVMMRQCAWCLRLIDIDGERISPTPLPKLYEATHGMCGVCGALWIEQVLGAQSPQLSFLPGNQEEDKQTTEPDTTTVQALQELPLHKL